MTDPNDRSFGIILLGASRFLKEGLDNPAFATSKARIAEVLTTNYILAKRVEQLDIFDQDRAPAEVVDEVHAFLEKHTDLTDLIIYYCGHGGFLPDQSYYLTLRTTREGREAMTGLQLKQFWIDLEDLLLDKRIFVVLDCCFAAAALRTWMADSALPTVITEQTEAVFPRSGTALFAAASPKIAAIAPEGRATTLFSGHLAEAIRAGVSGSREDLSLADLAESVRKRIRGERLSRQVMPQLLAPRQEEGDVSLVPFVRNPAAVRHARSKSDVPSRESWSAPSYGGNVQVTYNSPEFDFRVPRSAAHPNSAPPAPGEPVRPTELKSAPSQRFHLLTRQFLQPFSRALSWGQTRLSKPASLAIVVGGICAAAFLLASQYWPQPPPVETTAAPTSAELGLQEPRAERAPTPNIRAQDDSSQDAPTQDASIPAIPVEEGSVKGAAAQHVPTQQVPTQNVRTVASSKDEPADPPSVTACSNSSPARSIAAIGGPSNPFEIRPHLLAPEAGPIRAIVFSPDGKKFATASDDGAVRLWEALSFKLDRVLLPKHQNRAYSVAFSEDGSQLASASWDGTVRVWNVATGASAELLNADSDAKQYSVTFAPGRPARYVASAGEEGLINIWSLRERRSSASKPAHKAAPRDRRIVHSLSYSPKVLGEFVSGGFDGKIVYHFFSNGRPAETSEDAHSSERVFKVVYSPNDERIVSTGGDKMLKLWWAKARKLSFVRQYEGHKDRVTAVAWSPDGKRLVSGAGGTDPIRLWDVDNGRPLREYAGHKKDVEAVAFHPALSRIVSVSEDATMKVWDINGARELFTVIPFRDGEYLAYTSDGCYMGSTGADKHFKLFSGGKETALTADIKKALFVPGGFGSLVARP